MSPAPTSNHKRISLRLSGALYNYLKATKCEIFTAPFDVRLPRKSNDDKDIITVLQPDLCVICDPSKVEDKGCLGAPDIVIEILWPSNNKKELKYKHEVYEEACVKEYWVVEPTEKAVQIYILMDGWMDGKLLASGHLYAEDKDIVTTPILPGFSLDLEELFRNL